MDHRAFNNESQEDEEYIDLDDISVYENDPDYEPTEEEVIYYAERLGFDVENDPKEFLTIAYQALKAPLPDNWRRALLKSKDELVYINMEDQTIHLYTEIDEMAYKYYTEEKEKWMKSKQEKEKETRTKVVPRGKIPPLGSKEVQKDKKKEEEQNLKRKEKDDGKKSAKKYEKENLNLRNNHLDTNSYKTTNSKEVINEGAASLNLGHSQNNISNNSKNIIGSVATNSNQLSDPYNIPTKFDKSIKGKNMNMNLNVNVDSVQDEGLEGSHHFATNSNDNEPFDSSTVHPPVLTSNKIPPSLVLSHTDNIGRNVNHQQNNPSNEKINLPSSMDNPPSNANKNANIDTSDVENKRKEYFNKKLQETKEYETMLRENYNRAVEDYKQKRNQIKMNMTEEYERKIILDKRKLKDQCESELQKELKRLEADLDDEMDRECKDFQNELENGNRNSNKNSDFEIEKLEEKIVELKQSKQNLINEIDFYQELKAKQNKNVAESELAEAKGILEEKYLIEKKNLDRKYDLLEKEMELEEEVKHNKEIESLQKQANYNVELQEKAVKNSNSKLLEDFQKALEEDFNIQTKTILKEFEEKSKKEISLFKSSTEREKEEKIILYKKEMNEMEKEYYQELNLQREENRKQSFINDKKINAKFENVLGSYENLKKNVNSKIDSVCSELLRKLKLLIETQDIEDDYITLENKFEENIMSYLDEHTINCQRKKAMYEMLELEYKNKTLLLDYFTEIGSYMVNFLKENPTKQIDKDSSNLIKISSKDQKIYDEMINFVKEKQKEYKTRANQFKDKKLFDISGENNAVNQNQNNNSLYLGNTNGKFNQFNNTNNSNNLLLSVSQNNFMKNSQNNPNQTINFGGQISQNFSKNYNEQQNNFNKVQLTSERYREEEVIQEQPIENNTVSHRNNNTFYLNNQVISKLEQNDKNIVNIINDFLLNEQDKLEKEYFELANHKKIYENLKNTIDNMGVGMMGTTSFNKSFMRSNYKNSNLLSYMQILEDDREKIRLEERNFNHKKNIFDKIESIIEDCFIYLKNNASFETKKEMISDKLLMIKNQIDDYYEIYSELKKMKFNEMNIIGVKNSQDGRQFNNLNSTVKIGNSTDFFLSQKLNKNEANISPNENTYLNNNTFNNFFTLYTRKSLHDNLFLPTTNSFFNYKKNKWDLDSKLDILKTKMGNTFTNY